MSLLFLHSKDTAIRDVTILCRFTQRPYQSSHSLWFSIRKAIALHIISLSRS